MRREVREMTDRILTCKICSETLVFTAGEQIFYRDRYLVEPRRCVNCRRHKRSVENEHSENP